MHSSRMRTARSLTVSRSIWQEGVYLTGGVPARGVYLPLGKVVYLPGGVPAQWGMCTCPGEWQGGVPCQGVYLPGEVYLPRGVPAGGGEWCTCLGVYLPGGCVPGRGCTFPGGTSPGGVYLPGGCTCQGVPA